MSETVDEDTGEILPLEDFQPPAGYKRMPKEIAAAVHQVKANIVKLGFDERNDHGKYNFASVDKFYASVRPLETAAGLFVILDEVDFDVREGRSVGSAWAFLKYEIWLAHQSGVMWGPTHRNWAGAITGPQTFGAAESYIRKAYMRGLYEVPTGEKDGDEEAPRDDAPARRVPRPVPRTEDVTARTGTVAEGALAAAQQGSDALRAYYQSLRTVEERQMMMQEAAALKAIADTVDKQAANQAVIDSIPPELREQAAALDRQLKEQKRSRRQKPGIEAEP